MSEFTVPVLGFAAFSGTGKTTLLKKLLPLLRDKGLRVAVIKHAHHNFDVDKPGKDSYELRKAGATPMLISSSVRMAMMLEYEQPAEPVLADLIDYLPLHRIDCVLVEGFKQESFTKIELHRPAVGKPLMADSDDDIIAIATNEPEKIAHYNLDIPRLDIDNLEQMTEFVETEINRQKSVLAHSAKGVIS
jgi:molybdopterin-guanine dinucleotide biosynthesis protein B